MTASAADGGFRHMALLYRGPADYLPVLGRILKASQSAGDPVLVAVRSGIGEALNSTLADAAARVTVFDMAELGRNPARIIPAILAFAREHRGRRFSCITEPIWPGRRAEELQEATRHEALANLAFRDLRATVVCPYDTSALPGHVLANAAHTHPVLCSEGREEPSTAFLAPPQLPAGCEPDLSGPPVHATSLRYSSNLRAVRSFAASAARSAGLAPARVTDLVIAISELAANTLAHTADDGVVHIWPADGEVICQVEDTGQVVDPLARHRAPAPDLPGGKGLWLVNQVCDLVQTRTGPDGTTIRLHMRLT
jgi:anti-sigma regulatory factor (Ser/Thr protein kinase)